MPTKYTTSPAAYALIEAAALAEAETNPSRISVRRLVENVRAEHQIEINSTDVPMIARQLVKNHAHLAEYIELRGLGRRSKNKPKALTAEEAIKLLDAETRSACVELARKAYSIGFRAGREHAQKEAA